MEFTFRPLSWPDVESIATWHYDAPYTQYDGEKFASSLQMFLRRRWTYTRLEYEYYAVDNAHGDLIGFFTFNKLPRNTVTIGLGLRPELTGFGYGLAFVQAGIEFGKVRYAPASFRLTVAAFNARAIKVYIRAGFTWVKSVQTPRGFHVEMRRDA
jgi:ribosomal-protein-alanine N-acetyltransferase